MTATLKRALRFIASLLAGAIVWFATTYAYAFTVPSCVTNHAGFGFAMPGFITGAVGGFLTIVLGVRCIFRDLQNTTETGKQMLKLLRLLVVAFTASYVAAFVLYGAVFHVFKHECHLIPWSP